MAIVIGFPVPTKATARRRSSVGNDGGIDEAPQSWPDFYTVLGNRNFGDRRPSARLTYLLADQYPARPDSWASADTDHSIRRKMFTTKVLALPNEVHTAGRPTLQIPRTKDEIEQRRDDRPFPRGLSNSCGERSYVAAGEHARCNHAHSEDNAGKRPRRQTLEDYRTALVRVTGTR